MEQYEQRAIKQRFQISDKRRLTFYAAVFNVIARVRDRINLPAYEEKFVPGAFQKALEGNGEVIANLNHDAKTTFAKRSEGLLLQEDPHGLFCSAWVPEGAEGDKILADVESGKLDGCSVRFAPIKERNVNGVTEVVEAHLIDVCLTGDPAYPGTEVHLRNKPTLDGELLKLKYRLLKLKANA